MFACICERICLVHIAPAGAAQFQQAVSEIGADFESFEIYFSDLYSCCREQKLRIQADGGHNEGQADQSGRQGCCASERSSKGK